ncbi:MAG: GDSL-type esterase/lipase family protein, partial [Halobacteriota archaeon]
IQVSSSLGSPWGFYYSKTPITSTVNFCGHGNYGSVAYASRSETFVLKVATSINGPWKQAVNATKWWAHPDSRGNVWLKDTRTTTGRLYYKIHCNERNVDSRIVQVDWTAPQTVVCIGDSITRTWPEILQQRLGAGWTVIDKGVGGDATAGMLARFNADVIANHPRFVVICAGTAALGQGEGTQQIESNIAKMCGLAGANGIKPVLCTIPPREDNNGAYIQSVNDINSWVKTYAAGKGYNVIDFYALLDNPANPGHYRMQYSSGDEEHPNTQGYQAMGEYVPLKIFTTP